MFTDVAGYTAIMQRDEQEAKLVRSRHREALEAATAAHGGELVQYLGDGSLSTFPSVVRAVAAAVEVQAALRDAVPLRIGIHPGEIAYDAQGIYGDSVNVASRVMALAQAGSVLVSDRAHAELKNHPGLALASLGYFPLKNVREPVEIHAVTGNGLAVPTRADLLARSEQGRVYKGVTAHWPWIAVAVTGVALALALVGGGVGAAVSVQSYMIAWAAASAAVWFLFDKAEIAMSAQSRKRLAGWLQDNDMRAVVRSIPSQFVVLFDRVFGERHLSWRCFFRSVVASTVTVWVVSLLWAVRHPPPSLFTGILLAGSFTLAAAIFNVIPDYLSLLETRWVLQKLGQSGNLVGLLLADLAATATLGFTGYVVVLLLTGGSLDQTFELLWKTVTFQEILLFELTPGVSYRLPLGLFFYSTFFTSAWLWLYAGAVFASRLLVRMNDGIGFLLRATDVEYQPFRAMGFVSVSLVSILFVVGLPALMF